MENTTLTQAQCSTKIIESTYPSKIFKIPYIRKLRIFLIILELAAEIKMGLRMVQRALNKMYDVTVRKNPETDSVLNT